MSKDILPFPLSAFPTAAEISLSEVRRAHLGQAEGEEATVDEYLQEVGLEGRHSWWRPLGIRPWPTTLASEQSEAQCCSCEDKVRHHHAIPRLLLGSAREFLWHSLLHPVDMDFRPFINFLWDHIVKTPAQDESCSSTW